MRILAIIVLSLTLVSCGKSSKLDTNDLGGPSKGQEPAFKTQTSDYFGCSFEYREQGLAENTFVVDQNQIINLSYDGQERNFIMKDPYRLVTVFIRPQIEVPSIKSSATNNKVVQLILQFDDSRSKVDHLQETTLVPGIHTFRFGLPSQSYAGKTIVEAVIKCNFVEDK